MIDGIICANDFIPSQSYIHVTESNESVRRWGNEMNLGMFALCSGNISAAEAHFLTALNYPTDGGEVPLYENWIYSSLAACLQGRFAEGIDYLYNFNFLYEVNLDNISCEEIDAGFHNLYPDIVISQAYDTALSDQVNLYTPSFERMLLSVRDAATLACQNPEAD